MKIVISGSRNIIDPRLINKAMVDGFTELLKANGGKEPCTELVSGHARGVDKLAELWAKQRGIPVKLFIPDWDGLGKKAGILRNEEMANYGDAVLAIWDGESHGTRHMIAYARKIKKLLFYLNLKYDTYTLENCNEKSNITQN